MRPLATQLLGLGTAVPSIRVPQARSADFLAHVGGGRRSAVIHRMAGRTGIEHRHTVLDDHASLEPTTFSFYPPSWDMDPFPSTRKRLEVFEREAVPLAEIAARRALDEASVAPDEITHLVLTTCTGLFAPGPDQALVKSLGLSPDVRRTLIGFMGCYAGFNGIRTSDDIVRAHPEATVLQVAVELCTLHMQKGEDTDTLVANLLFADGAAAAVYGQGRAEHRARVVATASRLTDDTEDQMSWHIGDHGFVMRLSADVPRHLESEAPAFVDELFAKSGPSGWVRGSDLAWAVHPGGRRILDAVENALDLPELEASRQVLRDYGNMSSATILFVLKQVFERQGGRVAALGFGPGLTLEGATFCP